MPTRSSLLPPTWSRANPVDIIGDATGQRYADALQVLVGVPDIDGLLGMNFLQHFQFFIDQDAALLRLSLAAEPG